MAECLIVRKCGGNNKITEKTLELLGFTNVPEGEWELKTGSLAQTSLDGVTYIPLTAYTEFKWTAWSANSNVNVEDNLGTVYFKQYAAARSEGTTSYGQVTFRIDVDIASKYNKDCSKLLQITSVKGTPGSWGSNVSQTIKTWLEKVA